MSTSAETGACFCGQIVAQMDGEPFWICYDHDKDCRRATGAAVVVWVGYREPQFRLVRGHPKSFSRTRGVVRSFCPECGTSISYRDEGLGDELYVALGFFDHPERLHPQAHVYWREKIPWINIADDLPRVGSYSRSRDPRVGFPRDR